MEPMVKGYAIVATSKFLLGHPVLRGRLDAAFVAEVTRALPTYKPTEWYPRSQMIRLFDAIAKQATNEAEAYSLLFDCGIGSGETAVQGYLKLLLKVLTVRMFASKFPDFWARDNQTGRAEVEMPAPNRMLFHVHGIAGFNHMGPVSAGFIQYAMRAIGVKGLESKCTPWSLAEPGPEMFTVDVTWQ